MLNLEKQFNDFIKKWTGNNYPYLIDSDENDGEAFRLLLRQKESEVQELKDKLTRYEVDMKGAYKFIQSFEKLQKENEELTKHNTDFWKENEELKKENKIMFDYDKRFRLENRELKRGVRKNIIWIRYNQPKIN